MILNPRLEQSVLSLYNKCLSYVHISIISSNSGWTANKIEIFYFCHIKKHQCLPSSYIICHCQRSLQEISSAQIPALCWYQTRARAPTACDFARAARLLPSPADLRPAFLPHHSATSPVVSGHGGQQPCGGTSNSTHNVPTLQQLFILHSQFFILSHLLRKRTRLRNRPKLLRRTVLQQRFEHLAQRRSDE